MQDIRIKNKIINEIIIILPTQNLKKMRSYPIWNQVQACIYKSKKSYGAKDFSETEILVGSSNKNSHTLAKVSTRRREITNEYNSRVHFEFRVDGRLLKTMIFNNDDSRAGELIETINH